MALYCKAKHVGNKTTVYWRCTSAGHRFTVEDGACEHDIYVRDGATRVSIDGEDDQEITNVEGEAPTLVTIPANTGFSFYAITPGYIDCVYDDDKCEGASDSVAHLLQLTDWTVIQDDPE